MELTEFDEGPVPAEWIEELTKRGIGVRHDNLAVQAREVFLLKLAGLRTSNHLILLADDKIGRAIDRPLWLWAENY